MAILITGGAGFIGSALVRHIIEDTNLSVANIDCLTYAGNLKNLETVSESKRYSFFNVDITDIDKLAGVFDSVRPNKVIHLAAESHVDRSIANASDFIATNIVGTYNFLQASLNYYRSLTSEQKKEFRYLNVSTDEVYGDIDLNAPPSSETSPYLPSSPYSASKAASDHLVRSWHRTYGLPAMVSTCSNNYGIGQYPEKLLPVVINCALNHKNIPVYGDGKQIRDWLFVEDHVNALLDIIKNGKVGETYNIGGSCELSNLEIIEMVLAILTNEIEKGLYPEYSIPSGGYSSLLTFVKDRPGHDRRYGLDTTKIRKELNWTPKTKIEDGLQKTVIWYLNNRDRLHPA